MHDHTNSGSFFVIPGSLCGTIDLFKNRKIRLAQTESLSAPRDSLLTGPKVSL